MRGGIILNKCYRLIYGSRARHAASIVHGLAYVISNKRHCSMFCTIRHEASRGLFATAELLVNCCCRVRLQRSIGGRMWIKL